MFRSIKDLPGPLLDSLQYAHVCLVLGSRDLDSALQMSVARAEAMDDLPSPAGDARPNAAQDAVGRLCHKGTNLRSICSSYIL